jgi:hypothetical protein
MTVKTKPTDKEVQQLIKRIFSLMDPDKNNVSANMMGYALAFNLERLRQILINVRMSEKEQQLKPALHNFDKAIEQGKKDAMDYVMQSQEIQNEIQTIRKRRMEE